jgi:hypothetical protein
LRVVAAKAATLPTSMLAAAVEQEQLDLITTLVQTPEMAG